MSCSVGTTYLVKAEGAGRRHKLLVDLLRELLSNVSDVHGK